MAERFGWSLEYIDALSLGDLHEFLQVEDGKQHAQKSFFSRPPPGPKVRRK